MDFFKVTKACTAPKGRFRVMGIDRYEPAGEGHWHSGDFDSLEQALEYAREATRDAAPNATDPSVATVYYVFDDQGIYRGGDIYAGE